MRTRAHLLLAGLCLLLSAAAGAQSEEAEREAELFGGEPEEEQPPPPEGAPPAAVPADRDAAILGEEPTARTPDLAARLAEAEERLAIGGLLYLRLNWTTYSEGEAAAFPLTSPNLLDLYLDARPNDRVRAFVRGRVRHDFTLPREPDPEADEAPPLAMGGPREQTEVFLDQLWLNFDVARRLWVTVGRQPIRWGTGRFWQPTDFLNQQRRDPLTVFDERLGVSLLRVHVPVESLGWNFYAIANLEEASSPEEVGGALRAEVLLATTEVALTAALRKDDPLRLGLSISSGIWLLDLRADLALLKGVKDDFWRGELDFDTLTVPEAYSREDEWIPQAVLGAELGLRYSDQDALYLGLEYFWNDAGYADAQLYPWLLFQGAFRPFYVGRHYGGAYVFLPAPGRWEDATFVGSVLSNLSDRSWLARLDVQLRLLTWMDLSTFAMWHFGEPGELNFGLDIPPVPSVPPLAEGLRVAPPRLELGLWLATRF